MEDYLNEAIELFHEAKFTDTQIRIAKMAMESSYQMGFCDGKIFELKKELAKRGISE